MQVVGRIASLVCRVPPTDTHTQCSAINETRHLTDMFIIQSIGISKWIPFEHVVYCHLPVIHMIEGVLKNFVSLSDLYNLQCSFVYFLISNQSQNSIISNDTNIFACLKINVRNYNITGQIRPPHKVTCSIVELIASKTKTTKRRRKNAWIQKTT